jgi:GH35 family endo-1,4-beta-xylanase
MKRRINLIILMMLTLPLFFGCSEGENSGSVDGYILNLPPMKDHFSGKFDIGNIMNQSDADDSKISNLYLTHHFNVLTCENDMKPGYLSSGKGSYRFSNADKMVSAAIASGMKVVGHTLLWHSQNASWMNSLSKNTALDDMKTYITDVVGHFKGKIYSWDVLNEAFPDGGYTSDWKTSIRSNNPWFAAIGAEFVYHGFLAARIADPKAILYYNDYNTDMASKAKMIHDMVLEVNNKYLTGSDKPATEDRNRLLIEGIGMQEHHNTGVNPNNIRNTLNLFKGMSFTGSNKKVIISVSELDVLSQSWNQYSGSNAVTEDGRARQAELYGEYMKVYLEFSDIIERVSLWGVTDNKSWRARGEPLLFNSAGVAKPAYYSFVGALK